MKMRKKFDNIYKSLWYLQAFTSCSLSVKQCNVVGNKLKYKSETRKTKANTLFVIPWFNKGVWWIPFLWNVKSERKYTNTYNICKQFSCVQSKWNVKSARKYRKVANLFDICSVCKAQWLETKVSSTVSARQPQPILELAKIRGGRNENDKLERIFCNYLSPLFWQLFVRNFVA